VKKEERKCPDKKSRKKKDSGVLAKKPVSRKRRTS